MVLDPTSAPPPPPPWDESTPEKPATVEAPKEPETTSTPEPTPAPESVSPKSSSPAPASELGFQRGSKKSTGIGIVLFAVEKWGKTTFGAYAPDPAIIMAPRELGYVTLLNQSIVPEVDYLEIQDWNHIRTLIADLVKAKRVYKNIVVDAITGIESCCHQHVCTRDYDGDWGHRGFMSYREGYEVSVNEWLLLLNDFDRLKARGTNVILLGHATIKPFKNPTGPDYDRYSCDVHPKTWGSTHKWADAILFGNFLTAVETAKSAAKATDKGKGIGGTKRVVHTQRRDAWDAGTRFKDVPERIDIPGNPEEVFSTIAKYIPF